MVSVDTLSSVQVAAAPPPQARPARQESAPQETPAEPPTAQTPPAAPQDQAASVIYTALASASASTIRGSSVDTTA